ncbi:MAG TPA: hypothetical protein VKU62_01280 [Thermoanaerobaculia bacterium]|nr:hypothetical protein [Thermoanaerobaculia bacterium]
MPHLDHQIEHANVVPLPRISRLRAIIEERRGQAYSDAEWREARRNLLALFGKLMETTDARHER